MDYSTIDGFVNVKDFGAKGDGVTDDTLALQAVFGRHKDDPGGAIRQIYLPKGIYLISDKIMWGDKKKDVRGEGINDTIIKLMDNCPGFQNSLAPRKVLSTEYGFGGQNFNQRICDLTVDIGKGNPCAIGIGFHTNNMGGLTNVRVRSSDPEKRGHTGIMIDREWPGPGLIRQVEVDGFDTGIHVEHDQYSMTFEDIRLKGQRYAGFINESNTVTIRALHSENHYAAIRNSGSTALMVLLNVTLVGGIPDIPAIMNNNDGVLYARNVKTEGYNVAIQDYVEMTSFHNNVPGGMVNEYISHPRANLFPVIGSPIRLPIKMPPVIPMGDPSAWVNIKDIPSVNAGASIQQAIDAGADTIYLPPGVYNSYGSIVVRNKVRRIIGFGATIKFWTLGQPGFIVKDGSILNPMAPVSIDVERALDSQETFWVEHASKRPLVQRWGTYVNTVPGGEVFIEDTSSIHFVFNQQKVWMRQCNPESYDFDTLIENNGSDLWILGLKSEKDRTIITTQGGGRTELFGGLLYKNNKKGLPSPAFVIKDSSVNLVYRNNGLDYHVQVAEHVGGTIKILLVKDMFRTNRRMPLYVAKR